MKPIIGIIGTDGFSNKNCICVLENYRKAIIYYGGIPILILPPVLVDYYTTNPKDLKKLTNEEKEILINQIKLCNGILIPGGSKRYEHHDFICDYCNKNKIPLLGICMGMQTMCNYITNNKNILIEDKSHFSKNDYKHLINVYKNTKLFEILNEDKILVNSFHNYKVTNSGNYQISAYCDDVIEAIEKKEDLFNIGLQWHPEKNYDKNLNSRKIFKNFIAAAKLYYRE